MGSDLLKQFEKFVVIYCKFKIHNCNKRFVLKNFYLFDEYTSIVSMSDVNIVKQNFVNFIAGRSLPNYGGTKVINAEC